MPEIRKIKSHYDYIVIGAGSGGLTVAVGLKAIKKDVLVVSKDIGGDCTHYGCVPSKTLIHLAEEFEKTKDASIRKNVFSLIQKKIKEINKEEKELVKERDIPHLQGTASFKSKNTLIVNTSKGEKEITFKKCIVSTGSRPRWVDFDIPKNKILTNENIFSLKKLPKSITVIGAGPIGAEMAFALAKLGVRITIITTAKLLPREDRDLVKVLYSELEKYGVEVHENTDIKEITSKGTTIVKNKIRKIVKPPDYYLVAIGRIPNTNLNLEDAGVEYSERGIKTNNNLLTSNKNIFAIGDCTDKPNFTHLANNQGKFIVKKILFPFASKKPTPLPWVNYTSPPLATVGETIETEFVKRYEVDFTKSDRAIIDDVKDIKGVVYVNVLTGRIMGASVVGDFSEHIINFFTLAIKKKMKVFELENFIVPFPTYFNSINSLYSVFVPEYFASLKNNVVKLIENNFSRIAVALLWIITGFFALNYLASINFDTYLFINKVQVLLKSEIGILVFILLYIVRGLISFPATALTLLGSNIYGFWGGLVLIILASNLSSTLAYFMGKTVFSSKKEETNYSLVEYLKTNPFEAVLVARLTFIPYDLVSYISGAIKLDFKKFILATAIGSLPGTLAFVSFGASLKTMGDMNKFHLEPKFLILGVVLFVTSIIVSRLLKARKIK